MRSVRKSLKQSLADNVKAMDFWAMMTGKTKQPPPPALLAAQAKTVAAKKANGSPDRRSVKPLEHEIQKAVLAYLQRHPNVAFVGRFNRGEIGRAHV